MVLDYPMGSDIPEDEGPPTLDEEEEGDFETDDDAGDDDDADDSAYTDNTN